jgi:hypothetical protein
MDSSIIMFVFGCCVPCSNTSFIIVKRTKYPNLECCIHCSRCWGADFQVAALTFYCEDGFPNTSERLFGLRHAPYLIAMSQCQRRVFLPAYVSCGLVFGHLKAFWHGKLPVHFGSFAIVLHSRRLVNLHSSLLTSTDDYESSQQTDSGLFIDGIHEADSIIVTFPWEVVSRLGLDVEPSRSMHQTASDGVNLSNEESVSGPWIRSLRVTLIPPPAYLSEQHAVNWL